MNRVKNTKPPRPSFLLPAESAEQYEAYRRKIENAIEPADGIEEIFCEDVVYARQQMQRLQLWMPALFKAAYVEAVHTTLNELGEIGAIDDTLVLGQLSNDPAALARLSEILAAHGRDLSVIEAEAFRRCSRELSMIDQLLTSNGLRRDRALQSIAVFREMKARQPRLAPPSGGDNRTVRQLEPARQWPANADA